MNNVTLVLAQAKALSKQGQQELLIQLEEYIVLGSQVTQVAKEVKEMRFSKGRVCCYCEGTNVVRNGVQRYLYRNCNRSFSHLTNSATYRSKKTLDKWLKYAKCMLNGYSIRKSAEEVEISIATSFFWRHKILNCISEFLGVVSVGGVVEADEVFFAYSYKGTKTANMPRPSRKRGKQVKKRGIRKEQVCVGTALDRQGNIIIELLCTGRVTTNELERLYGNRIGENSILCTDRHKSYIQFATDISLDHKRIKRGRNKDDINYINSIHSNLKKWMAKFNGVATKYLANYMKWHKWINSFSIDKETVRIKKLDSS